MKKIVLAVTLSFLFSSQNMYGGGTGSSHRDHMDKHVTKINKGIYDDSTIQVASYVTSYNKGPDLDQGICFDLKSKNYRLCGSDYTEALTNLPEYYNFIARTGRGEDFCYDNKNQTYVNCTQANKDHEPTFIPLGYKLVAVTKYEYGDQTFYCQSIEKPELTFNCDQVQHNVIPDARLAIQGVPEGYVVATISEYHDAPSCSSKSGDDDHTVTRKVFFISLAAKNALDAALAVRWANYQASHK